MVCINFFKIQIDTHFYDSACCDCSKSTLSGEEVRPKIKIKFLGEEQRETDFWAWEIEVKILDGKKEVGIES